MSREVPQFALAGSFLEGLAAQDFGRLQAERLGPGWFTVEQQAYAAGVGNHIGRLDLLCTGYLPENSNG